MPTSLIEGSVLTIKEVATFLKVNDRTVYRLAGARKLPEFKVGDTWRFLRADIEHWIKSQTAVGASQSGVEHD